MRQTLALNSHALDMNQHVCIEIVFPDFTTRGYPHGKINLSATLTADNTIAVEFAVRSEEGRILRTERLAFRPDELIRDHRNRRRISSRAQ
jgi:hypothetical protein